MRVLAAHLSNTAGKPSTLKKEGNMKLAKYLSVAALFLVSLAAQLNAQTLAPSFNIAGSSAIWSEAGQGAGANNCGWTSSNSSGFNYTIDQRVTSVGGENQENGKLWIVWTAGSTGTCGAPSSDATVYAYINLDSGLGNRCLFAQPSCLLYTQATTATASSGAFSFPASTTVTTLPQNVINAVNGNPIVIAATDILPADAKFATYSTLAPCGSLGSGSQFSGLGYGPGPDGQHVVGFYGSPQSVYHVIDFNVYGNDPINTSSAVPAYTITPVGATPVVVAVNPTNTAGFGSTTPGSVITNVNRAVLGLAFGGIFVRTADFLPQTFAGLSASYAGITALVREPISGTYNTFEHGIPNNKEIYRSQDYGNCTGTYTVTSNPLNVSRTISDGGTTTTGYRNRVIGTGQMISEIEAVEDSIGYAFWSASNFSSATSSNMKYLTVDGVDPIQTTYSNGVVPTGSGLSNVTLQNVYNGSYPIWTELRFVSFTGNTAATTAAQSLSTLTQAQSTISCTNNVCTNSGSYPDFIPAGSLNVFHGHFAPAGVTFNSGNVPSDGTRVCGPNASPEDGGDVGGLVFTIQSGADYCVLKSNYNAPGNSGNPSGPTSLGAAFGVRQ
jgi:hypothetical protein